MYDMFKKHKFKLRFIDSYKKNNPTPGFVSFFKNSFWEYSEGV